MVRIFLTLISDRGFDHRLEYGVILKLVVSIYPFNGPKERGELMYLIFFLKDFAQNFTLKNLDI